MLYDIKRSRRVVQTGFKQENGLAGEFSCTNVGGRGLGRRVSRTFVHENVHPDHFECTNEICTKRLREIIIYAA